MLRLVIISLAISLCHSAYRCSQNGKLCTITGISQNEDHPQFIAEDANAIEILEIKDSALKIWADVACTTFPNLKELLLVGIGIKEIARNAFRRCSNLEILDLGNNEIRQLNSTSFKGLEATLKTLKLYNNKLETFAFDRTMPQLTRLNLRSNRIHELDEMDLKEKCPKLEKIWINDNDLKCKKVRELFDAFDASKICDWIPWNKYRPEQPQRFKNITCFY